MDICEVFRTSLKSQCDIGHLFRTRLSQSDNKITFIQTHQRTTVTYADFCLSAEQKAADLQSRGLTKGQAVLLVCDDEQQLMQGFWSIVLAGGIAVPLSAPLSFDHADEALQKIISVAQQCPGALLLTDLDQNALERLNKNHSGFDNTVFVDFATDQTDATLQAVTSKPDDVAMIMFSSGSTGEPKGVQLTHRNLLANLAQIAERSQLHWQDRSLSWLPLTHDMGLVLFHLCHTLATIDQYKVSAFSFVRDPVSFLQLIDDYQITLTGMPNFGFDTLLRAWDSALSDTLNLSSIRLIYNGAEPINPRLVRQFYRQFSAAGLQPGVISPGYGIAECCVVASQFPHEQLLRSKQLPTVKVVNHNGLAVAGRVHIADDNSADTIELVSLGPLMADMEARVLNDDGVPLGEAQIGHIELKGPNVSPGYWGQPARPWCRTGDIGFVYDNEIYITGRLKDVIFINGKNYYSNDLERQLCDCIGWPANQLAVVGYRQPSYDHEQIALFLRQDRSLSNERCQQIKNELECLLSYPVHDVLTVAVLPKTTSGKIRRFQLREGLISGSYEQNKIHFAYHPDSAIGERERWLWSQVCDLLCRADAPVDIHLPLTQYGFDSVRWLQLLHRIKQTFTVPLSLDSLMKARNIASISSLLPPLTEAKEESAQAADFDRMAMSDNQFAIWSSYLLDENQARYNESYSLEFCATVNAQRFSEAVRSVLRHHPMLNVIVDDGQHPELVYQHSESWRFTIRDLRDDSQSLQEIVRAGTAQAFNLTEQTPLLIELIRLANDRYCLFICAHHLIIDGWSFNLLITQIFNRYQQPDCTLGRSEKLWQPLQTPLTDEKKSHWQQVLENSEAVDLPTAKSEVTATAVDSVQWSVDSAVKERLLLLANRFDVTLYHLLATTIAILFSRLSDRRKVVIGTLAANRHSEQDFNRVGYFAQTQPYALALADDADFITLANQLAAQFYHFTSEPTVSLDRIGSALGCNLNSLIDLVYVHQNAPAFSLAEHIQILSRSAHRNAPRTGLYITSEIIDHRLVFSWEFDSTKYSKAQMHYYLDVFKHILAQLTVKPEQAISRLDWMTDHHRTLVTKLCRQDPDIDLDKHYLRHFCAAVAQYPDHLAVTDDQQQLSYRQLKQQVDALSQRLVDQGISKGDRICIMTDRSLAYVVAMLATMQAGAVFVPLDPALPTDRTDYIVADCSARFILTNEQKDVIEKYQDRCRIVSFSLAQSAAMEFSSVDIHADDGAYIIYTSGTTGQPKGVFNDHKSLANLVAWQAQAFAYQPGETMCQFAPFSFDVSLGEILAVLSSGLHLYILPSEKRATPESYLQVVKEKSVNVATVTPAFFYQFKDLPETLVDSLASMRLFILGGEALSTQEIQRFQALLPHVQLVNVYGPTETTVLSSFYFIPNPVPDNPQWQPLGLPVANTDLAILTKARDDALLLQPGEIYIAGAGVSKGYWNDAEKTNRSFVDITIGGISKRYYRTGDLARITLDGDLEFIGRVDNQIKIRGFRVELGEIEKALEAIGSIDQAVVVAREMPSGNKSLVAYYCGKELAKAELTAILEKTLPQYMLPEFFQRLERMPLTHNRKVDRKRLPDIDLNAHIDQSYQPPVTEIERALASIWCDVLALTKVGLSDSFFDLGGDSLLATKLLYQIKKRLQIDFTVAQIFTAENLQQMAEFISQPATAVAHPAPLRASGDITARQLDCYPTSAAQLSMVYTELSSSAVSANNIPYTLALDESIDPELLHRCLVTLASKYAILGCAFEITEQGVQQRYQSTVVDFAECECHDQAAMIDAARAFHRKKYDMQRAPLWRVLVCQSEHKQWLCFNFHHAIADGISIERFIRDLDYLLLDQPLPDSVTAPNYGDYCLWLSENQSDSDPFHLGYWQRTLASLRRLDLPLQQPSQQDLSGRQEMFGIDAELSEAFIGYCHRHHLSLFNAFVTLVSVVLMQLLKQQQFAVGLTFSGREGGQQDEIFGLFVNTLPLMVDICTDLSLAEQALAIQKQSMELLEHQAFSLSAVQRLSNSREPLFNVLFNQEVVKDHCILQNKPARLIGIDTGTSRFPLTFSLLLGEHNIQWRIEYQHTQLSAQWIDRLSTNLLTLIERVLDMPELAISLVSDVNDDLMTLLEFDEGSQP